MDRPASSCSLEEPEVFYRNIIKSLATNGPNGDLINHQVEIQPRKRKNNVDFLHSVNGIYCLFNKDKQRVSRAEGNKTGNETNCCHLKYEEGIKMLEKRVQELEEQNDKRRHMLIPERIVIPFQETKLFGSNFDEYGEKIMGWLKDPEECMIGVWGIGGVGKTALLKCIYNKLIKDDTMSQSVYWLDASECDNVYKLQGSIGTCFGLNLIDRENEMIRSAKLYSSLVELRNIVLIVDDIWRPFFEDEVGIPLGKNGWKIILTTRSFDLCQKMRCRLLSFK